MMYSLYIIIICTFGLSRSVICKKEDGKPKVIPVGGKSVLQMGRSFKNPLLRLLGTAILNEKTELLNRLSDSEEGILDKLCSLSRCDEWSQWSNCTASIRGQFGMVRRSRLCGRGPSFCLQKASKIMTTEYDSRVCMGKKCPHGFTETSNGFCFLMNTNGMVRSEAETFCTQKGGFVINVNNELKSKDLHDFLDINSVTGSIWLNGRRETDVNSPWMYTYESGPRDYDNWKSGEPSKRANELCTADDRNPREWYDRKCDDYYGVVCELV